MKEKNKLSHNILELANFVSVSKEKYNPASGKDFPCVELEHIDKETGILNGHTRSLLQASIKNRFYKGDVLFGKLRPNLRKYAQPDFDGVCSTEIWVLNADPKKCSKDFLFYLIQSERFIQTACKTTGSKMPRADWEFLSQEPFYLPPLAEQKKIAAILRTWDDAIEKQQTIINKKRREISALTTKIFEKLLRDKKHLCKAESFFETITQKNKPELPLLAVTQDKGVIPRDLLDRRVVMPDGSVAGYKVVHKGDFVISLRSFEGGFEYSNYTGLVSPTYTVLRATKPICDAFYRIYFKSYSFVGRVSPLVFGIRDGKSIAFRDFGFMEIPYPPVSRQEEVANALTQLEKSISIKERLLESFKIQKRGLMQKLLTGEWRVNVSGNPEAA